MLEILDITKFYPSWWSEAMCYQKGDNIFFGTEDAASSLRFARRYCADCPVVKDCLTHALTQPEEYGIWGGTSARNREQMRASIESGDWELDVVVDTVISSGFKWRSDGRRRSDFD